MSVTLKICMNCVSIVLEDHELKIFRTSKAAILSINTKNNIDIIQVFQMLSDEFCGRRQKNYFPKFSEAIFNFNVGQVNIIKLLPVFSNNLFHNISI